MGLTVRGSNPGGGEIFRTCPDRPWAPPSLPYNGYRVFPGGKEWQGRDADPHPLLVPWSRKSRAIPLLPVWAVRLVQSFSACTRVHFTVRERTSKRLFWEMVAPVIVEFLTGRMWKNHSMYYTYLSELLRNY